MFITAINQSNSTDSRCKSCIANSYRKLSAKYALSDEQERDYDEFINRLLGDGIYGFAPVIHRELHHKLTEISGIADPYLEEKRFSNAIAEQLYDVWKPRVMESDNPFDMALRLSIAGNIMDYAAADHTFDLDETISKALASDFTPDDSMLLRQRVMEAGSILYLGDNAGEIVFDKLFIETMLNPYVTYAVRSGPIINDATLLDAYAVGMDVVADVISNGFDASSTILGKCSPAFLELYNNADLIISKGQGNLEGLINQHDPRIFFLFMVKCDVIAERIGVEKGSLVVCQQQ